MTLWTWINRDGEILRQETPLGWSMEACEPADAMAYKSDSRHGQVDMLASAAAPSDGVIENPREIRRLEILIKGVDAVEADLTTPRQTVLGSDTNGIRLLIEARDWPDTAEQGSPPASAMTEELAATPFIQTGDPKLVRQAQEITAGLPDTVAAARAINDWVFTHVRKNPAASLPSAIAVLNAMEGDCNEHTYLAVGLLRSAGIPAKVKSGVVYMNDRFYYHAWVAAYARGVWVELDPTFGQTVADATHLALAEGELEGQARLLRYVGRLSVGILKADKELTP
jgi:transglutaminase-like putative cysteine protease